MLVEKCATTMLPLIHDPLTMIIRSVDACWLSLPDTDRTTTRLRLRSRSPASTWRSCASRSTAVWSDGVSPRPPWAAPGVAQHWCRASATSSGHNSSGRTRGASPQLWDEMYSGTRGHYASIAAGPFRCSAGAGSTSPR